MAAKQQGFQRIHSNFSSYQQNFSVHNSVKFSHSKRIEEVKDD